MQETLEMIKVREKVQVWLLEEGYKLQSVHNDRLFFNFDVVSHNGQHLNILQPIEKADQIMIATRGVFAERLEAISKLTKNEENELIWKLRFGLLNFGVGFLVEPPLNSVNLQRAVYYDGLSKDLFMCRLSEVERALLFCFWVVNTQLKIDTDKK
jgi:hypothetical protein